LYREMTMSHFTGSELSGNEIPGTAERRVVLIGRRHAAVVR